MLIGDWDRHEDQWRWAKFKEGKETIYRPVPRDRDQAFPIMSDGVLLSFTTSIMPTIRLMKSYEDDIKSAKWFNLEPYPLDMALINESDKPVWDSQVKLIMDMLTDEVIDNAFTHFPDEVNDETIKVIKRKLQGRRTNLQMISDDYYNYMNKYAVIKGTNKEDWFDIERLPNGQTKITGYRIKKAKKADAFNQRTYSKEETKEIWVYGLDDDDIFKVFGKGNKLIKIRLIGGQNKDVYDIINVKKVKIYDYKSKESVFVTNNGCKKLTDDYETNSYDYKKLKKSGNQIIPILGVNPDDGFKIGITDTYTDYGFERNPFTFQHKFSASYYFATQGYDINYNGEFASVIGNLNLGIDAIFTSPNYAFNFFGYGNDTPNPEADEDDGLDVDLDYNRLRISTLRAVPSLIWRGRFGASFKIGLAYEAYEVENTEGRYINTFLGDNVKDRNNFYGVDLKYDYSNSDNEAFPTLGMMVALRIGYRNNISTSKGFDYGRVWIDDKNSDTWHTSRGVGIFANAVDMLTLNFSAFNSDDGLRLAFRLGFGF